MSYNYSGGNYNPRRRGGGRGRGRGRRWDYDDPRFTQMEERNRRTIGGLKRNRDDFETNESQEKSFNDRIKALLVRIGERSSSSLAENLDMLSKALRGDIAGHIDYIVDMLFECATKLTVKTPIYGCLVGLMNAEDQDFGAEVVARLNKELCLCFNAEDPSEDLCRLRLLVRFLGCLCNANVVLGSDVIKVFKTLLSLAAQDISTYQKDHLVHIVMSALCWSGKRVKEAYPEKLSVIMTQLEVYMEQRGQRPIPEPYRAFKADTSDYLWVLWDAVKGLDRAEEWVVKSIIKPEDEFARLKKGRQHPLKWRWNGVWSHNDSVVWIGFGVPQIIDPSALKDADVVPSLERCVVSEYIFDLFRFFGSDPKLCVDQLVNMPASFDSKYIVVEATFGHLLRLPFPYQNSCFYTRLIIELFKMDAKVWPKVIGAMVNTLFHNLEKIDIEARDRVAAWFAHHLVNFNHQWPWQNWNFVHALDSRSPKKIFIRSVLNTQIVFSYYDRVHKSVPGDMKELIPPKHEGYYKFSKKNMMKNPHLNINPDGTKSMSDLAQELLRTVNQRLSSDQLETVLDTWVTDGHGKWASLELVMTTLLHTGRQSYSHFFSGVNTYKQLIKDLLTTEEAQIQSLEVLKSYWMNSPDHIRHLADKLQALKLVSAHSIVKWALGEFNREDLWKPMYIQIVSKAVVRQMKVRESLLNAIDREREAAKGGKKKDGKMDSSSSSDESDDPAVQKRRAMAQKKLAKLEATLVKVNASTSKLLVTLFAELKTVVEWSERNLAQAQGDSVKAAIALNLYQTVLGRFLQLTRILRENIESQGMEISLTDTLFKVGVCSSPKLIESWAQVFAKPVAISYRSTMPADFMANVINTSVNVDQYGIRNVNTSMTSSSSKVNSSTTSNTTTSMNSSSSDSSSSSSSSDDEDSGKEKKMVKKEDKSMEVES